MSEDGWTFHVLLATSDGTPWETDVRASDAVRAANVATAQWEASVGEELATLTHVLVRRNPSDMG